jgi:hypothetical protein
VHRVVGIPLINNAEKVKALGKLCVVFLPVTIARKPSCEHIYAMRKAFFRIGLILAFVAGLLWIGGCGICRGYFKICLT